MKAAARARPRRIRRQPEDAREEILAAARAIVEEEGHAVFTIDAVMQRTGMTRSAFYHYFRDVEDLAVGAFEPIEAKMIEAVDLWLSPEATFDPAGVIRRSLEEVVDLVARNRALVAAIDTTANPNRGVSTRWRNRVLEVFVSKTADYARSLAANDISRVEDPDGVAKALILMNHAVLSDWARNPGTEPPAAVAHVLTTIWTGALLRALPKGRG